MFNYKKFFRNFAKLPKNSSNFGKFFVIVFWWSNISSINIFWITSRFLGIFCAYFQHFPINFSKILQSFKQCLMKAFFQSRNSQINNNSMKICIKIINILNIFPNNNFTPNSIQFYHRKICIFFLPFIYLNRKISNASFFCPF